MSHLHPDQNHSLYRRFIELFLCRDSSIVKLSWNMSGRDFNGVYGIELIQGTIKCCLYPAQKY